MPGGPMPGQCIGEERMWVGEHMRRRRCEKPTVGNSELCADHRREGASVFVEGTRTIPGGSMPRQCIGEERMRVGGHTRRRRCEKPTVGNSELCADHRLEGVLGLS